VSSSEPVTVLIVGRGGREHALAWKLAQSPRVGRVLVAPGNGGTAAMGGKVANIAIDEFDFPALIACAHREHAGLVVVGPEAPLAAGATDHFEAAGLLCFGPSRLAAQLESSKIFAKRFMKRHGIPTSRYGVFTDTEEAMGHLSIVGYRTVIKASGLAAGKGVVIPETRAEAEAALKQMLDDRIFGEAGREVLIEERMEGPEASVLCFCDGQTLAIMPVAQDHKRVNDNDQGPNTGGMGAYAPAPVVTPALLDLIRNTILEPTIRGMAAEGMPFAGVLYAGLMLTKDGPRVIEFNCRFGDPETQVILPLLASDLLDVLEACAKGSLDQHTPSWRSGAAVAVVAASGGYPGAYSKGAAIAGLDTLPPQTLAFHAGTRLAPDGRTLTDGGRVLAVTGIGDTLAQARARANAGIATITFDGMHYRRDIGAKAS
jgi:phosphoribosylamine--glycine ligase